MGRPVAVKQSDIERAIKAATAAGLTVAEIVIEPKSARVIFGVAESKPADNTPKPKEWPKV